MKRFLAGLVLSLFLVSNVYAVGWIKAKPAAGDSPSDISTLVVANNTALDLMLSNYRRGAKLSYSSASQLTVGIGEVACSNATGSIRLMVANTSATTVTWANIDTGSEAASTTYYVYAICSAITDTTFTVKVSTSSSAPTGVTYYQRLGYFTNDSSSNITDIVNDDNQETGKVYDSGWRTVANETLTHSLGTTKLNIKIYAATDSSGANMQEICPGENTDYGYYVWNITTTQISFRQKSSGLNYIWTGSTYTNTWGYYRIIILALE